MLQTVQLDSLLPQNQTQQFSVQKTSGSGESFLDLVRFNQEKTGEAQKRDAKNGVSDKKTEKKQAEEPEKKQADSLKTQKTEGEEPSVLTQSYSALQNENEKISASEQVADQNSNLQIEKNLEISFENALVPAEIASKDGAKTVLTDGQMEWLKTPVLKKMEQTDGTENLSADEFARLIESAVDFIPGEAGSEELLEKAQNLSASDPEMFLKNAAQGGEVSSALTENFKALEADGGSSSEKTEKLKEEKKSLKFQVSDFRTEKTDGKTAERPVEKTQGTKELNLSYKKETENTVQVTMDLSAAANRNITSSDSQSAGANGSVFQNMLSNAVQANAQDFVKAGNLILRDNNQGSINLVLNPEKLGNVKISLNLSDKLISASITVHSREAYEAMKDGIASLKEAFAGNGFETGDFNLNFANQGGQFSKEQGGSQQWQSQFFGNKRYSDYSEAGVLFADEKTGRYSESEKYAVNIVA